ncbi:MAG: hypothetical protein CR959_01150 [Fusobacteriales bacterium]|nr:MAG: hypothetical protein CR959_01150 [Fusobacteriales bacterium]
MKKIFLYLFALVLVMGIILYVGKNFIVREILVRKLSEINRAPVSIESVDLSLRENYITLKGIKINSNLDKEKVFIKMDELKSFYKIDNNKHKILFDDTEIAGFLLFDKKMDEILEKFNSDENKLTEKEENIENNKSQKQIKLFEKEFSSSEQKYKKQQIVEALKNIYMGKVGLGNDEIDARLRKKYVKFKELENNLEKISPKAIDGLKESIDKIKDSKKDNVFSAIFSELKSIEKNAKKIFEEAEELGLKEKIKEFIKDEEFKKTLDSIVKEFLDKNDFLIVDLDSYINLYLNSVYEEKIYNIFLKYNKFLEELNYRKEKDRERKDGEVWEFYFENVSVNSKMYGINFYGELKNISSRISKNKKDIPFKLFGEKGETIGEIKGVINLDTNILQTIINIPEANLIDIDSRTFENGKAYFYQELQMKPENLSVNGILKLRDMQLNSEKIVYEINTGEILVDELVTAALSELKNGNIKYKYNSDARKLEIISDISETFQKIINDDESFFKTNIRENIKKEYLDTILD